MLLKQINVFRKIVLRSYSSSLHKNIKEITKNVHPFSKINISTTMKLLIRPYDLLDCPNANLLKATIIGSKDCSLPDVNIDVKSDTINITNNDKITNNKCKCILEIPIKSDLNINSDNNVEINDMHSDNIELITKNGNIMTKNLRAISIWLQSKKNGNINCNGLLLAQNIYIETDNNGAIHLDKIQGTNLQCMSNNGQITTNSCYVDNSKFQTKNGILNLNNVHKNSEIFIEEKGDINMIGIHGTINIKGNGNNMDLQFAELYGHNSIILNDTENVIINISDFIEKNCSIDIYSENIQLDKSIEYMSNYLENNKHFCYSNNKINHHHNDNKLIISTKGLLKLGKKSWADNLKAKLEML